MCAARIFRRTAAHSCTGKAQKAPIVGVYTSGTAGRCAKPERRMFKVECIGCQAPYQVDEKRVPEKGLKMRCPKCGTTFKVEAPAQAGAAAAPSDLSAPDDGIAALPAPVSKPFASAGPAARKPLGRP